MSAFDQERLLDVGSEAAFPYPIKLHMEIAGAKVRNHRPSFVQENGTLYVFEPVDFSTGAWARTRDHAGLCAYMFGDIRSAHPKMSAITLARYSGSDTDNEELRTDSLSWATSRR